MHFPGLNESMADGVQISSLARLYPLLRILSTCWLKSMSVFLFCIPSLDVFSPFYSIHSVTTNTAEVTLSEQFSQRGVHASGHANGAMI